MTRVLYAAALVALAALAGYLAGSAAQPPPVRASATPPADVSRLEARIADLERQVRSAAARLDEPRVDEPQAPPAAAPERAAVERSVDPERQREWLQRLRDADTPEKAVAVLRAAHAQVKTHEDPESLRRFLEEVVNTTDPLSAVHFEATMYLAYDARGAGDYARADELIHRVLRTMPRNDARFAEAQFQLAWNRKQAGDPAGAEQYFRDAAESPVATAGTKTAAWYNVAYIRAEAGDRAGAAEICRRLLEEGRMATVYTDATKALLASVEPK